MSMTLTSVFLALTSNGSSRDVIHNPSLVQSQSADSVHVLAFSSHGELLVAESEGSFTLDEWDQIFEAAKAICCGSGEMADDHDMEGQELEKKAGRMSMFVKSTLQAKVTADLHWKD